MSTDTLNLLFTCAHFNHYKRAEPVKEQCAAFLYQNKTITVKSTAADG